MNRTDALNLADGYVVVVQQECETCVEIAPVLIDLANRDHPVTIVSQDNPDFLDGLDVIDDTDLEKSWRLDIEVTPTLIRIVDGEPAERLVGWDRTNWESFLGVTELALGPPDYRPGCGSLTNLPGEPERLMSKYGEAPLLRSRRLTLGSSQDLHEAMFDRGWTDGLPVVPPTPLRVERMLAATQLHPSHEVVVMPPDLQPCTVEKIAINAVMAGCLPEYLPVVLAAVKGVASDEFNIHGVSATTWNSGPIVVVNGPIAEQIGMNSGFNVFGPGNRANATIGRAVNLIIRNVGGARPGEIDRSMQGHPSKFTMAFAEREHDSPWESLACERGVEPASSAVTLFAGQGPAPFADQASRSADSLARSLAACLKVVRHPKLGGRVAAIVAISPEHGKVFAASGWSKDRLRSELVELLTFPGDEMVQGVGGIAEGMSLEVAGSLVQKFKPENLWFVHAGNTAGLFSGIISGWVAGDRGSQMVTVPIEVD